MNLIVYEKANPVDAVQIIGPHVKSVHAKDGLWPADSVTLGEEVLTKAKVYLNRIISRVESSQSQGSILLCIGDSLLALWQLLRAC